MGNPRLAHSCHTRSVISFSGSSTKNAAIRNSVMRSGALSDTSPFPKGDTEMYTFKKSLIAFVGMHCKRSIPALLIALAIVLLACTVSQAAPTLPPGNTVQQWNTIAENTVVGSGAFQAEGFIYMGYVSSAMYDAVVSIEGGYEPYSSAIPDASGALADAAVVEAAYRTLVNYFPSQAATLDSFYTEALALIPDGTPKTTGQAVGLAAATNIINLRTGDGRLTPIGVTSSFPTLPPSPGVWRLTPSAFAPHRRRGSAACGLSSSRKPISFYLIRRPRFRAASGWRHSTRSRPTARQPAAREQVSRQRSQDSGRRTWSGNTTGSHAMSRNNKILGCCRRRG